MAYHQNIIPQQVTFVDDFIDDFETSPAELMRFLSTIRNLDERLQANEEEVEDLMNKCLAAINATDAKPLRQDLKDKQKDSMAFATEKVQLAQQACEIVERQLKKLSESLQAFEQELEKQGELITDEFSMDPRRQQAAAEKAAALARAKAKAEKQAAALEGLSQSGKEKKAKSSKKNKDLGVDADGKKRSKAKRAQKDLAKASLPMPFMDMADIPLPAMDFDVGLAQAEVDVFGDAPLPHSDIGRKLTIKYDGSWYMVEVVDYDEQAGTHTILYPDYNQQETLRLGIDVTEDDYQWIS
mmetsp:Transcript_3394/g.12253  ORF Transcript_3394/g.12253 Transcript_3394/m.12253 type:complete len:298 (+) Transcript_3394:248-1141(+)